MKLDKETQDIINDACLDDSTKVIRYLEEQKHQQKWYNLLMLILASISAIGAVIAAIVGILPLLH